MIQPAIDLLSLISQDTPLKRAGNVAGRGTEYHGPCPFCGGKDRLRVQPDSGQWWCRQCSPNDHWQSAADYVMRRDNVSFKQAADQLGISSNKPKANPDSWDYVDSDGTVIYQVVRFIKDGHKSYAQRVPERDGWKWGLNGTQPTIYRLPEVVKAASNGETIYIAEGEKCVDALRQFGLVATTNSGGAGKWRDTHSQHLKGAGDVVIFQDNDEAGRKHAADVLRSVTPIVPTARIVSFDELPEKGDVADWLALGHTKDELLARCVKPSAPVSPPVTTRLTQSERIKAWLQAQGYTFRLNLAGSVLECNGQPLEDYLAAEIRMQYRDSEQRNIGMLEDVWRSEARKNAYHPIKEYLTSLQWDGQSHITKLSTYFESSDPEIVYDEKTRRPTHSVYLYRWLIGAVAKVFDRQQNAMLVLGGPQDAGKSSFVRWLCSPLPELYFEGQIQPGERDSMLRFATNWIWEVAEVDATTRRADRSALKGALTTEWIVLRKAYGHFDTRAPAIASFIGTFNPDHAGFLDDPSGSRRFWVTTLTGIKWAYQQDVDINQVWAEAVAAYRAGKSWRLLPEENQHRARLNEEHEVEDPMLGFLERYFYLDADVSNRMDSAEIIMTLNDKKVPLNYSSPRAVSMDIARALKKRGMKKVGDGSRRYYVGIMPR